MAKIINVKKPNDWKKVQNVLKRGLGNTFKNTRSMFVTLGAMIDRDTQMTFSGQGHYLDRQKWIGFGKGKGVNVYRNKNGTWQKRPGTDGAITRRFSSASKLLQASGQFKQSFRILSIGRNKMRYGTQHTLAEKIMSNPTRNALYYTNQDQRRYGNIVFNWINRKLKF